MPKKVYILREGRNAKNSEDTEHLFTGNSPRHAALKAARRGHTNIMLRERGKRNFDGTYTIHVFRGSWEWAEAKENKPEWVPEKIKMPIVKKEATERIDVL